MASKTISISEKAYSELRKLKKGGESFTSVILNLVKQKEQGIGSLLEFVSDLHSTNPKLMDDLADSTEQVVKERKNSKWRVIEF